MTRNFDFPSDSPMADFLDTNLTKLTKYQYIRRLKIFFDSLRLQGSLDKQSREFVVRSRNDRTWIQDGLKYFIRAMKKRAEEGEISESSIRNFYKPIKLFCSIHDIELSWKKITNTIPIGRRFANDRAPTHEEISRLIGYPDRRIKPIVLTTCSSGIRLGAWNYLKWKHIVPMKKDDKIIAAKIIVYAGENEQYYSFITLEAFEALQEWMEYRRTSGENIDGESWLMRTVWDTTLRTPRSRKAPKKMSDAAIKQLIERALRSEGLRASQSLDKKVRRYEYKTIHGFRKFFQTNAEPRMKSLDVMILMGQDTGLAASYNKPTVEMLLEEYLKAVDNLTINKTIDSHDVVKNQQTLVTKIQEKDQEIHELKEQMNKMQKDLQDIKEFELKRLRDPNYVRNKQRQEVEDEMKRTGKNLLTVLAEGLRTDAILSPRMMESLKKLPRTTREVIVEKLIALVKRERGYEENHPEIKKIKGLLVDVDVDYDVITEEDLMCYKVIQSRFNLEEDRISMIHNIR